MLAPTVHSPLPAVFLSLLDPPPHPLAFLFTEFILSHAFALHPPDVLCLTYCIYSSTLPTFVVPVFLFTSPLSFIAYSLCHIPFPRLPGILHPIQAPQSPSFVLIFLALIQDMWTCALFSSLVSFRILYVHDHSGIKNSREW